MSPYNVKHKCIFSTIMACIAMIVGMAACSDDLRYGNEDIPDAEVEVDGELVFRPLVPTAVLTRADAPEGTQYRGIRSLYVFFFNSDRTINKEYSGPVDFIPAPSQGSTHERVSFKTKIQAGRYYVYAVANVSEASLNAFKNQPNEEDVTIENLKKIKVDWNRSDIGANLAMFGVFGQDDGGDTPDNESFEADRLLTVTPASNSIHSWVRRAVSKVTVDFNGDNLLDGVTVYIKDARLVDVASAALLGTDGSHIDGTDITVAQSDYIITYGKGSAHTGWPAVTRQGAFTPQNVWEGSTLESFHDEDAQALPCYENMQGETEGNSKLQDNNGDGVIDSIFKDGKQYGTYLEVKGYYVANRTEYKSQGDITYRFMLGKDALRNFDVVRNHHYKITMNFKGYGSDIDWHIEYSERYLDASYPMDVNYQGKFFKPNLDYGTTPNAGHEFDDRNVITVTSYKTDGAVKSWIEPDKITYSSYTHNDETGVWVSDIKDSETPPAWLEVSEGDVSEDGSTKQYTYVAEKSVPVIKTINGLFPTAPLRSAATNAYNLSNADGGNSIQNTANCYMVGAPGWYSFPLIYGNAVTDGDTLRASFSSTNIKNHLGRNIKWARIKDNVRLANASVRILWQDFDDSAQPFELIDQVQYVPGLFDGTGGIRFHIGTIKEGNAVIALIDNNAPADDLVNIDRGNVYGTSGSTKAVWSWHIWATRFGTKDLEKDIRVINHDEQPYDVMPVNLGWCSGDYKSDGSTEEDKGIKYYKRRKCEITFTFGDRQIVRTIEQYPHLVLPRGNHPYYQWGRKDPFVGTKAGSSNKDRYVYDSSNKKTHFPRWSQYSPPQLFLDPEITGSPESFVPDKHNQYRRTTKECLHELIQNPDKWHNCPKQYNDKYPASSSDRWKSANETFPDLWSNNGIKTVYDPSPAGYQVAERSVFTGFTVPGITQWARQYWYDVREDHMDLDYYSLDQVNSQVIELYTDTRKLQSISFPITGYRDYDQDAFVVSYSNIGQNYYGIGYVWLNAFCDNDNSYHLKFQRGNLSESELQNNWRWGGSVVGVYDDFFYNTDGFGVRPVRIRNAGVSGN